MHGPSPISPRAVTEESSRVASRVALRVASGDVLCGAGRGVRRVASRGVRRVARRALPILLFVFALALSPYPLPRRAARAQEVVDRMVATINGRELITYTDLLWQLALQPDTPLERPRSEDLQQALARLIDQRLIAQEAGRLPTITPTEKEVSDAINDLIRRFPTQAAFYQRIGRVGLTADQLSEIVRQRVEIQRYLDFRFRSFVVVTDQEIADYYRDVFVPRFRRRQPGVVPPTLEAARQRIERAVTEAKIESDTDAFLEDARARAEIIILNPV
jgi:hypothetical protein